MSRDRTVGETFYIAFTTRAFATGIPTVLAGSPVISAYEDAGLTQITAGLTLGVDHDSVVGLNMVTVVATGGNGFEAGKDYQLVITTGTVGGVSVVGEVVGHFSLGLSSAFTRLGAPNGASVSVDVAAIKAETVLIVDDTGELQTDWTNGGRLDLLLDAIPTTAMRGTDNAATATGLSTHDGKLDTLTTTVGTAGAGLTDLGAMSTGMKAEVQSECNDALVALDLDHLTNNGTTVPAITAGTYFDQMLDDGTASYDRTTDSLQAIRDRGDSSWITGGGGGITDVINVKALIPTSIDLANTATIRLGLMLTNALDDLPSTAEITPGTISIHRKAIGGTSWSAIVTDAACSEIDGLIYYDEVFDSGSNYAEGDSIRVTFKSQKVTVAANDYEIIGSTGRFFYTEMRQSMRGTDSANTTVPDAAGVAPTAVEIRQEVDSNSTELADIVSKLPTALVGGRMDSNMSAIDNDNSAAVSQKKALKGIFDGAAVSGTLSTTEMTTDLTVTVADQFNDRVLIFADDTTTVALRGQGQAITATTVSGSKLGFAAFTTAPAVGDTFSIY